MCHETLAASLDVMATQKGQMVFVEVNIEVRKVEVDNREPVGNHGVVNEMCCITKDIFQCVNSNLQDLNYTQT